jgi:hypothetical protein
MISRIITEGISRVRMSRHSAPPYAAMGRYCFFKNEISPSTMKELSSTIRTVSIPATPGSVFPPPFYAFPVNTREKNRISSGVFPCLHQIQYLVSPVYE